MMQETLSKNSVKQAHHRIRRYINHTPVVSSSILNHLLGHKFYFKLEALQKIGAFKARGAMNTLLSLREQGKLPEEIVSFSSGNHAQGVAWAAKTLGIKANILMSKATSSLKIQATRSYGANVILTESRMEAEDRVEEFTNRGVYFLHPYNNEYVIAGQGTACYEALRDIDENIDAIFAPCGGGGLVSGTYLATELLSPGTKVIGCEPINANDAARSLRSGEIYRFQEVPDTIADGVMTLSISDLTFEYLKKLDDFMELEEEHIIYWTQWLTHLLKINIEPSSALAMAGAVEWLKDKPNGQNILVIISGGNISADMHKEIWQNNYLEQMPTFLDSSS